MALTENGNGGGNGLIMPVQPMYGGGFGGGMGGGFGFGGDWAWIILLLLLYVVVDVDFSFPGSPASVASPLAIGAISLCAYFLTSNLLSTKRIALFFVDCNVSAILQMHWAAPSVASARDKKLQQVSLRSPLASLTL